MNRPIFSYPAAVAVALMAAACAETPSSVSRAPAPGLAAPAPADVSALVGRDARAVAELLGPPRLKRRDPPAELWQYRAGPCILDLFLYAGKDGGAARVAHIEIRAFNDAPLSGRAGNAEINRAECLRAVKNASGRG